MSDPCGGFLCFPQKFIKTSCSAKLVVLSQGTSGYTVWKPWSLHFKKKKLLFLVALGLCCGAGTLLLHVGVSSSQQAGAALVGVFIAVDSLVAACRL